MYYSPRREHHFKALTIDDLRHSPRVLECTEKQHRARHYIYFVYQLGVCLFHEATDNAPRAKTSVFWARKSVDRSRGHELHMGSSHPLRLPKTNKDGRALRKTQEVLMITTAVLSRE